MSAMADEEKTVTTQGRFTVKQMVAAAVFFAAALALSTVVPSIEIAWVTGILMLTIYCCL